MTTLDVNQTRISRRTLLAASAATMAAFSPLTLFGQTANSGNAFGGLPMGIHGATFKNFPVEQVIRLLVEDLQLHHLEMTPGQIRLRRVTQGTGQGPAASITEVRDLRRRLQSAGITPSAWGPIALGRNDSDLRQLFELASELGVANLTCMTQAEDLDTLENLADEYRVRIAIHNNAPGSSFSDISSVLNALQNRGPNVGACLDTGNAIRAGEDPALALSRLGSKVYGIHLKSVSSRDPDSEVVELGTGLLDTDAFFRALREATLGANVALSLEYLAQPDDPIPGTLRSLALVQAGLAV